MSPTIPLHDSTKAAAESVVTVAPRDSNRMRAKPKLEIVAPESASVYVNGVPVGSGSWQTDTLKPQKPYMISATLPSSVEGCYVSTDTRSVRLTPGKTATVTMRPRLCGSLRIDARPD